MRWKRNRDREEGKGGGAGRIKGWEAGGKNKRTTVTGFGPCTSGDDDGFNEATVNSLRLPSSQQTHKHAQSGGDIDLKLGGSLLTRPSFYFSFPRPIVITGGATCGMGGVHGNTQRQQVRHRISDCC